MKRLVYQWTDWSEFCFFQFKSVQSLIAQQDLFEKQFFPGFWRPGMLKEKGMVSPFWGCKRNNSGPAELVEPLKTSLFHKNYIILHNAGLFYVYYKTQHPHVENNALFILYV